MALLSTQVWEVRSAGSDNNGGGFDSTGTGTDFSKQDAAEDSGTDLVIDLTTNTIVRSATHNFVAADVGNLMQITAGTGFTVGFYRIVSVAANDATLDRSPGIVGLTGGTWALGGALATLQKIAATYVAGNTIWVKGSFTRAASDVMNVAGTATNPVRIIGYGTTRGDGYLGRDANGVLITTNMPSLAYNATFGYSTALAHHITECLNISANITGNAATIGADSLIRACKIVNASTNAAAIGLNMSNSRSCAYDCDVALTGASGGLYAIDGASTTTRVLCCRITGGTAGGIRLATAYVILNNLIYDCALLGIDTATVGTIFGNTVVNCGGDAIQSGSTQLIVIMNNCITDNTGFGIDLLATTNASALANNRTRDNTAGAINSGGLWASNTTYNHITTDTGGAETDYQNTTNKNFQLVPTSPAKAAGTPPFRDIGAFQHKDIGNSSTFS